MSKKNLFVGLWGAAILWIVAGCSTPTKTVTHQSFRVPSVSEMLLPEKKSPILDVPIEDQFDEPELDNGCEVTALSMLLRFYGFDTDKNQLADKLDYVPLYDEDTGYYGNPADGFVGDIEGGDEAMGVGVEPITRVAAEVVGDQYQIHSGRETSLEKLLIEVDSGTPVWIIATVELEVPTADDFLTWETAEGDIQVSPMIHSVVLTGYDETSVYVNDPYGTKNRKVPMKDLQQIYQLMGSQSLYLTKK